MAQVSTRHPPPSTREDGVCQWHNSEATGGIQKEAKDEKGRPEEAVHQHGPDEVASREISRDVGYSRLETTTLINKAHVWKNAQQGQRNARLLTLAQLNLLQTRARHNLWT